MATEIERKFLLHDDSWRQHAAKTKRYRQGYLANNNNCSVRLRVAGETAHLNIKTAVLDIHRTEYEYAIPKTDAEEMLEQLCAGHLIDKTRYFVPYAGHTWEIDVFEGENDGLILAEIELSHRDESFQHPPWLGREVSDDPRYYNVYLAEHPFKTWKDEHTTPA